MSGADRAARQGVLSHPACLRRAARVWPRAKLSGALGVNGVDDHVHAAAKVPPTISISDFLAKLKANTSKWAKRHCAGFAWQEGYTAFTVSESQLPPLREYIRNQEKHHRKMTFQEELAKLLKAHRIKFDVE